jgi:hypothetical protein
LPPHDSAASGASRAAGGSVVSHAQDGRHASDAVIVAASRRRTAAGSRLRERHPAAEAIGQVGQNATPTTAIRRDVRERVPAGTYKVIALFSSGSYCNNTTVTFP